MEDFYFYFAQVVDGIAYGSIYGVVALSIVLLYRANKMFNFAQTEIAMFFVIMAVLLTRKMDYTWAFLLTIILSFIGGGLLHIGVMRFITERRNVLSSNQAVVTIGFFTIFNSLNNYLFGDEPEAFPTPFGTDVFKLGGLAVSHHSIGILAVSWGLLVLIFCFFRFTRIGMIFDAVSENVTAARLRGIRASNILAMAWGLTVATSTMGGMLIAPILFVTPNMLINIYAYALIAVVVGGMESPLGALLGGIIVGVVENLASNASMIGSELKFLVVMFLLIAMLIVKPRGLWGRSEARRV
ncbi:MAG: branched-chain amino acid ABC transporter permease [Bdellovibrionales bacterium]